MNDLPSISLVIPTYNRKRQLLRLLESILSSNYPLDKLQVIVIVDASTDGTVEAVRQFKEKSNFGEHRLIVIINSEEQFPSYCRNLGIDAAKGDYILFLDDDLLLDSNTIIYMINYVKNNKVIAGPSIYYLNEPDTIWCAGFKINRFLVTAKSIYRGQKGREYNSSIVCDALPAPFLASRECALRVRFNDIAFKICNEEIDFCLRASKLGYKIVVVPWAKVWHERRGDNILYELFYMKNPMLRYFQYRNNLLLCRMLNKKTYIFVISLVLQLMQNFIQIVPIVLLTSNRDAIKNIMNGMSDGLRLAVKTSTESY